MVRDFWGHHGMDHRALARADVVGRWPWRARREASLSLLVQRKEPKKAHPGPRAPAAARPGSVSPMGILGRHILVPAQNAAHRARRPSGLPTGDTAADGAPKGKSKSRSLSAFGLGRSGLRPRAPHDVAFAVAFAFRAPFKAWQAGRVNPQGGAQDVRRFRQGQDAPSENSRTDCGPGAKRRARRQGCVSLPTFFAQAKKVGPRGERAIGEHRRHHHAQAP